MPCENNVCKRILDFRPPRIAMAFLLLSGGIHLAMPESWSSNVEYRLGGVVAALLGFALMIRAWWLFRKLDNAICPTADTSAIIVSDVFSLSRNPMYLGIVLILIGMALFVGSWTVLIASVAYLLVLNHTFCRYEEVKLEALFGDSYRAYARRVRRWL